MFHCDKFTDPNGTTDAGLGRFIVGGYIGGDGIADFILDVIAIPPTPPLATDFVLQGRNCEISSVTCDRLIISDR